MKSREKDTTTKHPKSCILVLSWCRTCWLNSSVAVAARQKLFIGFLRVLDVEGHMALWHHTNKNTPRLATWMKEFAGPCFPGKTSSVGHSFRFLRADSSNF